MTFCSACCTKLDLTKKRGRACNGLAKLLGPPGVADRPSRRAIGLVDKKSLLANVSVA